jgi:citrate lyase subunit beta/citryl-CoA lyase
VIVSRSYLFVPGDSARKFERAIAGAADALILDLEDSIAPKSKAQAREATREMLSRPRAGKRLLVRVNALDTGLTLDDLAATMPARPDGIVLPKCASPDDVRRLGFYLDALETVNGDPPGSTGILAIATETAASLFGLGGYRGCSQRLFAMMWGAEDLAASLGASENRDAAGFLEPFRLARNLLLAGAAAAGLDAVDTVYVDIENLEGLRAETLAARRDGFAGKAVIHPKHVEVVNAAFEPSEEELAWARKVVAAFEESGSTGAARLDGKMIDQPHLHNARRLLRMTGPRA